MTDETRSDRRQAGSQATTALQAGASAPDFTLRRTPDQSVSLHEFRGQPLFVLNAESVVHWRYVSPIGINPGAEGVLSTLEDLQGKKEAP